MLVHWLLAIMATCNLPGQSTIDESRETLEPASRLIRLTMTGELAKEYAVLCGDATPEGLHVQTIAIVSYEYGDGRIRIVDTHPILRDGKQVKLVTLTAELGPDDYEIVVSPDDSKASHSPTATGDHKATQVERTYRAASLSNLEGITLRSWTLEKQIGDGQASTDR